MSVSSSTDAESIANLLRERPTSEQRHSSKPDGFWIAEQFLSIPAEIRPEAAVIEGCLPSSST